MSPHIQRTYSPGEFTSIQNIWLRNAPIATPFDSAANPISSVRPPLERLRQPQGSGKHAKVEDETGGTDGVSNLKLHQQRALANYGVGQGSLVPWAGVLLGLVFECLGRLALAKLRQGCPQLTLRFVGLGLHHPQNLDSRLRGLRRIVFGRIDDSEQEAYQNRVTVSEFI
jgi:hypothetical protein